MSLVIIVYIINSSLLRWFLAIIRCVCLSLCIYVCVYDVSTGTRTVFLYDFTQAFSHPRYSIDIRRRFFPLVMMEIIYMCIVDRIKKNHTSNRMSTAGLCGFRRLDGTFLLLLSHRSYRCPWITVKMRKFHRVQQPLNWLNTIVCTCWSTTICIHTSFLLKFHPSFFY